MRSSQVFIVTFESEDDIVAAVRASRKRGFEILDTYTPYAVHGLDEEMGLKLSKLPWMTFAFGLTGATLMLWFQFWASWISWPINIGGKPFNSLPSFVPAKFEIVVLFAGIGTFLSFLTIRKLFPGKKPFMPVPRVTDNQFVMMLGERGAVLDLDEIRTFFGGFNAVGVESSLIEPADTKGKGWKVLNASLFILFLLTVGFNVMLRQKRDVPNFQFISNMYFSVPYDSFAPNPNFADGKTLQMPVRGAITTEQMPLHYGTSVEEADRAGRELTSPIDETDAAALARGGDEFQTFCKPCHGVTGSGDGIVPKRGYPPPPSLLTGAPTLLKDGRIFHAITYGKGNMPSHAAQVSREDRWKIVLYVRSLQKQAAADAAAQAASASAAQAKTSADAPAPATAAAAAPAATAPVAGKTPIKKASEKAR